MHPQSAALPWQVHEVSVRYGEVVALDRVSLSVSPGRILGLLGPNGAGKTTLLEASVGLRPLTRGQIHIHGVPADRLPATVRGRVGMAFQDWGVPPWTPVETAVRDRARLYRNPADVPALLTSLQLSDVAGQSIRRLSGGQQRRVATALALVGRPDLAFLDEPAAGLDPHARLELRQVLRAAADAGMAIVMSSHIGEDLEVICDDIAILDRGQVRVHTSVQDLLGTQECVTFSAAPHAPIDLLLAALPARSAARELAHGRYQVTPPAGAIDPLLLSTITAWASAHGQPVRDVRIGVPSLTDHYLALTGNAA